MGSTAKSTEGQKRDAEKLGKEARGEKRQIDTHAEEMSNAAQPPLPLPESSFMADVGLNKGEQRWLPLSSGYLPLLASHPETSQTTRRPPPGITLTAAISVVALTCKRTLKIVSTTAFCLLFLSFWFWGNALK